MAEDEDREILVVNEEINPDASPGKHSCLFTLLLLKECF